MRRKRVLVTATGLAVLVTLIFSVQQSAALPEYTSRTNEPCATCHINPAGGGPRTEQGQAWVAAGKPDKVPTATAESATPTPAPSTAETEAPTPTAELIVVGTPTVATSCSQFVLAPKTTGCGGN